MPFIYRDFVFKVMNAFEVTPSILFSTQEIDLYYQKAEVNMTVLHIMTALSIAWDVNFKTNHIEVYIYTKLWIFLWSLFLTFKTWIIQKSLFKENLHFLFSMLPLIANAFVIKRTAFEPQSQQFKRKND